MSPKQDFKKKLLCSTLHPGTIPFLGISGRNTIPIQSATKIPLPGTIGKNHIQSRFHFLKRSALFTALNMILSLGIIPFPLLLQVTVSSGLHSVLERPFSEANGRPFLVKRSPLIAC